MSQEGSESTTEADEPEPGSGAYVSRAIAARAHYLHTVSAWDKWLRTGRHPSNGEQLLLYKTIKGLLAGPEPGRTRPESLPTLAQLGNALNARRFQAFEQEVEARRATHEEAVESAAQAFIDALNDPRLTEDLAVLDVEEQLPFAGHLVGGLCLSGKGLAYAKALLQDWPDEPSMPALHFERFAGHADTLDFKRDFPATRRFAQAYAAYFGDLVSGLAQLPPTEFMPTYVRVLFKWVPLSELPFPDKDPTGQARQLIDRLRDTGVRRNLEETFGAATAGILGSLAELLNVYLTVGAMVENPTPRTYYDVVSDVSATLAALAGAAETLYKKTNPRLFTMVSRQPVGAMASRMVAVASIFTFADGVWRMADAHGAWVNGEYNEATGLAVEGAGLMTAGVLQTLVAIGLVTGPAAVVLLAIATVALLVCFAGRAIISWVRAPPLVQWLSRTYFGVDWDIVAWNAGPESEIFRFKRQVAGRPDIPRQLSALHSMNLAANGLNYGPFRVDAQWHRGVLDLQVYAHDPENSTISADAGVAVKRIVPAAGGGYEVHHIVRGPVSDDMIATADAPDGRVSFWLRELTAAALTGDPETEPSPQTWYEIDIVPLDEIDPENRPDFRLTSSKWFFERSPFALRTRFQIPARA